MRRGRLAADRATEIAWTHEGRWCGDGRGAPLERTQRIHVTRLTEARAHVCVDRLTLAALHLDSRSLVLPHADGGGCGVFVCSRCRKVTPWCLGAADDQPKRCDFCWRPTDDA